jgi:hypothetical protein
VKADITQLQPFFEPSRAHLEDQPFVPVKHSMVDSSPFLPAVSLIPSTKSCALTSHSMRLQPFQLQIHLFHVVNLLIGFTFGEFL